MWKKVIATLGDPIEREGFSNYEIDFANYGEFWLEYVFPNRNPSNSSKLKDDFPQELEALFNSHYSVFYHLTISHRQIRNFDHELIGIHEPLYHLASAIDLVERTFAIALEIRDRTINGTTEFRLSYESYEKKFRKYWAKRYDKDLLKFQRTYSPVMVSLHRVGDILDYHLSDSQPLKQFKAVANQIRPYRNVLIHSLCPLRIIDKNDIYIPKFEYLSDYKHGLWSSKLMDTNLEHYAPATEILDGFAKSLVSSVNHLWVELLAIMETIVESNLYKAHIKRFGLPFEVTLKDPSANPIRGDNESYTGGSIDYWPLVDTDSRKSSE